MKTHGEKETNKSVQIYRQEQNVYFTVVLTITSSNISSKHKRTSFAIKSVDMDSRNKLEF
jgi:hypothetical protein